MKGEFGIVYRGLLTPDGDVIDSTPIPVAIKTLKGQCYYNSKGFYSSFTWKVFTPKKMSTPSWKRV